METASISQEAGALVSKSLDEVAGSLLRLYLLVQ